MKNDYVFRRCRLEDCGELANLLNQIFGRDINRDYIEWKHFKSQAGQTLSSIALWEGKIVASLGAIPVKFVVDGKETKAAQEVDVATLKDHRKLNVVLSLIYQEKKTLQESQVDFTYGITVPVTSQLNHTLLGKKKISPVPRLIKILDVQPFIEEKWSLGLLSDLIAFVINRTITVRYPYSFSIPEDLSLNRIERFDERFDIFWDMVKTDYPIMLARNSTYLNWRYVENPYMNYEIYSIERTHSNDILGFVVAGTKQRKVKTGNIYDIVTPRSEDPMIARTLIRYIIKRLRLKKAKIIECWMFPHTHIYPELIKAGFRVKEIAGYDFSFQCTNGRHPILSIGSAENPENWYITKGDSDNL
jgi:hypothetical protein